ENYKSYYNLLSEDGIMIIKCPHLLLDTQESIKTLKKLDDNTFKIKMPFYTPLFFDMNDCYIFASKKYHPIADIILQRADMLEDLQYYHANLHLSAFTLPKALKKAFLGIAKN
ncbi:MAG: spermidine synthase, partial [Helicobacter sp.]|nr:spermidine synthase [Helicobacter sp.]